MVLLISVLIFGYVAMQIRLSGEHTVAQISYQSGDALLGLLDSALERSAYRYKTTACDSMSESALALEYGTISVDAAQLQGSLCVLKLTAIIGNAKRSIEVGLTSSAGISAFAVGKRASVVSLVNGAWQLVPTSLTEDLNDTYCFDASNCWIVGDADTLVLYQSGVWTVKNPSSGENYSAIACAASDNCFVAGNNASGDFIRRWNGTDWSAPTYVSARVLDIQCPSTICYAVGEAGLLLRYNGSWNAETSSISSDFNALACTSGLECWAVTSNDKKNFVLVHRNGNSSWQTVYLADNNAKTLRSIACSNTYCWAGGDNGHAIRYASGNWSYAGKIDSHAIYAMSCRDSDNACVAVGNNGSVLQYDGSSWTAATSATNHALNAAAFFAESAATTVSANLWREVY